MSSGSNVSHSYKNVQPSMNAVTILLLTQPVLCPLGTLQNRSATNALPVSLSRLYSGYTYNFPRTKTAALYHKRLPVKMMVQKRQCRKSHIDQHYCAAIFRYYDENMR